MTSSSMDILQIVDAAEAHPFGDSRMVRQAFPQAIPSELSDPFLMCDYFTLPSRGIESDPDEFPIGWHPHRGMDILSYMKTGVGRHGDSMGHRETFETPGMQWISCGSGIEHAEGGASKAGQVEQGFQIWLNVPAVHKMDDPSYGTELPEAIPQRDVTPGVKARLLAGSFNDNVGPFGTKQPVQMMDFEITPGCVFTHAIPQDLDTCIVYIYEGQGTLQGQSIVRQQVVLFEASFNDQRTFEFKAGSQPTSFMLFAGKKIKEPIAWRGPIVMNTNQEIMECFSDMRSGKFPPTRVPWNYKRMADFPNKQ